MSADADAFLIHLAFQLWQTFFQIAQRIHNQRDIANAIDPVVGVETISGTGGLSHRETCDRGFAEWPADEHQLGYQICAGNSRSVVSGRPVRNGDRRRALWRLQPRWKVDCDFSENGRTDSI